MKTPDEWFEQYGASHQNPINKMIHWVCIPLIVLSVIGLLWSIPSPFANPWINFGTLTIAAAVGWYTLVSPRLALGMAAFSTVCVLAVAWLATLTVPLWIISLVIFVAAWIVQFIGHNIEGKKPSFFEDLQFLLVGPMWLLGHLYRKAGIQY